MLTPDEIEGTSERLGVAWRSFSELVDTSNVSYLADGAVRLRVDEISREDVVTKVEGRRQRGLAAGAQPANVTSLPAGRERGGHLTDRRRAQMGLDFFFALSFVRRREDLDPVPSTWRSARRRCR